MSLQNFLIVKWVCVSIFLPWAHQNAAVLSRPASGTLEVMLAVVKCCYKCTWVDLEENEGLNIALELNRTTQLLKSRVGAEGPEKEFVGSLQKNFL